MPQILKGLPRPKILLVDDREQNLLAYEVVLRDLGVHVACDLVKVLSGREAIEMVRVSEFAVMLLDVQMPDLDGFATARRIRDLPNGKLLPVLFVTAGLQDADIFKKAHQAGAIDFLSKPIDPEVLLSKVQLFIELYQGRQIIRRQTESRAFLNGTGEMPKQFLQKDWSQTPLGSLDDWPQSLRTAVSILLQSSLPMFVAWGPERVFLYNDAYCKILGNKHPAALGRPFQEVWPEIWDDIEPLILQVDQGQPVYLEDMKHLMNRSGFEEETYFTFSYSPLRGEAGGIDGLFCAVVETTSRKRSEKNLKEALEKAETSEKTLNQIFNESPAFMSFVSGPNHVFVRANRRYYEVTGRSEILGKTMAEVFPEVEGQGFLGFLDEVYRTGKPYYGYEMSILLNKDNEGLKEVFFDFVYQPMFDNAGKVYGIVGQGTDVTHQVLARRKAEESDRDLRLALESARMGTWRIDLRTNEIAVSPQLSELLGFSPEKHDLAKLVGEGIHEDDRLVTQRRLDFAVQNETPYINEYRAINSNGVLRWFSSRGNVVYTADGRPMSLAGVTVDITDRKLAEISLERNARLVESMPQPFFAIGADWNVTYWNPAAAEVIGMEAPEVLGKNIWEIFPGLAETPIGQSYKQVYESKVASTIEAYYPPFDRWYETSSFPFDSGVAVAFMDISDRKRAEIVLAEAKREAERASALKSAFLANMSHEIRTPLGAMIGFADLLRDPSLEESERFSYIDIITRNGNQLALLINDILDLSKVESGHLRFESRASDPKRVVNEVVSLLSFNAKEKNLRIRLEVEPTTPSVFYSDPARLQQILVNIVGNAIKFTQSGEIVIHVFQRASETQGVTIGFEVTDTGIGIAEEKRVHLFRVFSQADESVTRKYGGTGLGLALSKKLANGLGGDVVLQKSTEGVGSTFLVTVKSSETSSQVSREDVAVRASAKEAVATAELLATLKVLLVEDSPDNQQLIGLILEKTGAKIEIANNGVEGVSMALKGGYDLVLMDIQMPLMDGYTATQRLRDQGFSKPIIALTAHAMSEVREKCLQVGCTDHLPKPINARDLVNLISKHAALPV